MSSSTQANPIKGLTKKQVEQIFTGEVTDWSAVGGSGQDFDLHPQYLLGYLHGFEGARDEETRLRASAQKMAGNEQIAAEVAKNANGVGYVGLAYMKAEGIKVVPIDGRNANPGVGYLQELALCTTNLLLHEW